MNHSVMLSANLLLLVRKLIIAQCIAGERFCVKDRRSNSFVACVVLHSLLLCARRRSGFRLSADFVLNVDQRTATTQQALGQAVRRQPTRRNR